MKIHLSNEDNPEFPIQYTEKEWKELLSPNEYYILREHGTEPAFSGDFYHHKDAGTYKCRACNADLFSSDAKYDSGSGWPSFFQSINKDAIYYKNDISLGMLRTEIMCNNCGSHLGHVFNDGPKPTNQRYCVNSRSLDFQANNDSQIS